MSNVSDKLLEANRVKATNKPREAFVNAWDVWCRDTAKDLVAAPTFEERTALLAELGVCQAVLDVLTGAAIEEAEREAVR
jgi:hypothetical protein